MMIILKKPTPNLVGPLTTRGNVFGCGCCSSRLPASGPCAKCKTRSSSLTPPLSLSLSLSVSSPCRRMCVDITHGGNMVISSQAQKGEGPNLDNKLHN